MDRVESLQRLQDELVSRPALALSSWDSVNETMVRHWCEVMGIDSAPYLTRRNAPEAMLHSWTMPGYSGIFPGGKSVDLLREAAIELGRHGFRGNFAVQLQQAYRRPLKFGEHLRRVVKLESISPQKSTAAGEGHFITELGEVFSDDELVGSTRLTLLAFSPAEQHSKPTGDSSNAVKNANAKALFSIPLDTRFIIAASIATRDFEDVHTDPDRAREKGGKDVYVNIMTTLGLVQRAAQQLLGRKVMITELDLRLLSPAYSGDVMTFKGQKTGRNQVEVVVGLLTNTHAVARLTFREE